jgi:ABC-2 type transport system ATP-binding protein
MDEAEYCGRLGIMSAGRLLAMDTPTALKRDTLPGPAWNLVVDRLIPALDAMEQMPGVFQVGLHGDHLHAITLAGQHTASSLQSSLEGMGFSVQVEPADPTLEDAFIALAGRRV